jgi:hypothetical protein
MMTTVAEHLLPTPHPGPGASPGRRLKPWFLGRLPSALGRKPPGMRVPDRVWRRHSAFLICVHEARYEGPDA